MDFSYNGSAENEYGAWVIQNGAVNFSYNGLYFDGFSYVNVTNGHVDGTVAFTGGLHYGFCIPFTQKAEDGTEYRFGENNSGMKMEVIPIA